MISLHLLSHLFGLGRVTYFDSSFHRNNLPLSVIFKNLLLLFLLPLSNFIKPFRFSLVMASPKLYIGFLFVGTQPRSLMILIVFGAKTAKPIMVPNFKVVRIACSNIYLRLSFFSFFFLLIFLF